MGTPNAAGLAGGVIALLLWRHHVRKVGLALMAALFFSHAAAAKTGKVHGIIYTLGSDRVQTVWPNARITLKNLSSQSVRSPGCCPESTKSSCVLPGLRAWPTASL